MQTMPTSHGVVIAIGRSQYQTGFDIELDRSDVPQMAAANVSNRWQCPFGNDSGARVSTCCTAPGYGERMNRPQPLPPLRRGWGRGPAVSSDGGSSADVLDDFE